MSRHLVSAAVLLLCVLVSGCLGSEAEPREVELFKPREAPKLTPEGGSYPPNATNLNFYGHSLAGVDGVLVALAVGVYREGQETAVDADLWALCSPCGGDRTVGQETAGKKSGWTPQMVAKQVGKKIYDNRPFGPKAVVRNKQLFLLVSNFTLRDPPSGITADWDIALFVGSVDLAKDGTGKQVSWEGPVSLKSQFDPVVGQQQQPQGSWKEPYAAEDARGVAVGEKIIFPLQINTIVDGSHSHACTAMYSEDNGSSWKFPATPVAPENCSSATLIEWAGKLFMATSASSSQQGGVYESSDEGKTWREATGPFARLLGDAYAVSADYPASELMTATIANRSVLLYTQLLTRRADGKTHSVIHLWVSDGARAYDVGPISAAKAGYTPFSSLLYTSEELFALFAKEGESKGEDTLVFARLADQLARIKAVLQTWDKVDARVAALCGPAAATAAAKGPAGAAAACVGALPTDGLVGFLSNNSNATHWNDEFLGVNATVSGEATKVENGFQLAGRGAHIVWPVGGGEHGAEHGSVGEEATLVATVTIDEAPQVLTPLLGVGTISTEMYMGLWHDEHKRWRTIIGEEGNSQTMTWKEGRAYRVVLTVKNGGVSAYVDGRPVGSLENPSFGVAAPSLPPPVHPSPERPPPRVLRVLIGDNMGGQENSKGRVTVTNVLLYNRGFNASEVAALEEKKKEKTGVTAPRGTNASDANAKGDTGAAQGETGAAQGKTGAAQGETGAAQGETGGSDGSARGRLSAVLPLPLLLALWALVSLL